MRVLDHTSLNHAIISVWPVAIKGQQTVLKASRTIISFWIKMELSVYATRNNYNTVQRYIYLTSDVMNK
jgi:hypothetical protein